MSDLPPLGQTPPAPPRRQGPRPLGLHLSMAMTALASSPAGLPSLNGGWPIWRDGIAQRAAALREQIRTVPIESLTAAVDVEMRRRMDRLLTGIERYRHHPYRRDVADPPTVWAEYGTRLLEFADQGQPVLLVPSLINRGYILDLSERKSLARWLAQQGFRPWLVEWGAPGPVERSFTLTDYIAGRLERAITAARERCGGAKVALVGYCMGGMLATAAALRRPDAVSSLVLLATPWDFHGDNPAAARRTAAFLGACEPALLTLSELPVDAIQMLFAGLDPYLALKKFSRFARLDPDGEEALDFVALEDWLNDGVALPAAVARECLGGWYGHNLAALGGWRIAGQYIDPKQIRVPALAMIPAMDRIVPPASASALIDAIPGGTVQTPPLGHIGMIVSRTAQTQVWQPLAQWLHAVSASG